MGSFFNLDYLRIEGKPFRVETDTYLPAGKATRERFYKYRDPEVERPVLLIVSPHEH